MSESAKEARRAYDRAYYRKNPEKQREKMRRYWERKSSQDQDQGLNEDSQIKGIENTIAYLKQERKDLNKKIMANRQNIAMLQNVLKGLKEQRRQENDKDPR